MKKYIAEFIGTFALTLVVIGSIAGTFPVPTPILAGLTLALFVYSIGHISGTHINPAVTLGLLSIGKIKTSRAIGYIIAQFVGAFFALMVAKGFLNLSLVHLTASDSLATGLAEMFGAFFFTFGIASVVYGRAASDMSGVVVGGSLFIGITIAATLGSNGVLNPAVAYGIGSFNIMYLFGPIVGSIVGMNVYKQLSENKIRMV